MFEVTEKASDMIKNFLKDRENLPAIRLMLAQGGWSGPQLGLALDELRDDDESFDDRGLTFVVEKEFYEKIKPVTIDYVTTPTGEGFQISSSMPEPESACGTSCSCWNKSGDLTRYKKTPGPQTDSGVFNFIPIPAFNPGREEKGTA